MSSDFDSETTSFDDFILASSPQVEAIFNDFNPLGRLQIIDSSAKELIAGLVKTLNL